VILIGILIAGKAKRERRRGRHCSPLRFGEGPGVR